jgi:gliding motility-associated-like protein
VRLPDTLLQEFPYTEQLEGDLNLMIRAVERGKYRFKRWEVVYGTPIDLDESISINYPFFGPTRLIAHFEERLQGIYIPNSFTPNGDGYNDILKVYGTEISEENFRFAIMNRWGKEIWGTTDITKGWNGAVEGSDYFVPPGPYAYFLRYVNAVTGEIVETSGSILLIR